MDRCPTPFGFKDMSHLKIKHPQMYEGLSAIINAEDAIIERWVHCEEVQSVLLLHGINPGLFLSGYAGEVFNYFVGVVGGVLQVGDCPIMATFLEYLKDRDVSSDELFTVCTHFRKAMLDFLYETGLDSGALFCEISYVFDQNFSGVLKMYSGRLHEKEMELAKNVRLLNAYKNAIDESAIVSKTDEYGVITYVNDKFVDACGYAREELIGYSHNMTRHDDMPSEFFETLWQTIGERRVFRGTMHNRKKSGESYYVDLTIVPIYDPVKEAMEYMGIGYEVTRLVEAKEEAELAGQAKEYFLSNMSHEIRTPLNAVLGFVSLLMDENRIPRHQKYLDIIYNSGENLLSIINDILDFSKLQSGEFTVEKKPFNLHDELTYTLELFAPSATEKQITLFSFIDPDIPSELIADPLRLKQIVANLLSNALKFTPHGGCIDILVQLEGSTLKVLVQDNGVGISPDNQEKIFNAFSQVKHPETKMPTGTGLGLSICKKLAEHMGGAIELESALGEGSRFTLMLPVECIGKKISLPLDLAPFEDLRIGLLTGKGNHQASVALLERYWEVFSLEVVKVDAVDAHCCDLLFFVDSDIDGMLREKIMVSGLPTIAIMEYISDKYDAVAHITPLYFPIYCMKLYNAMGEALQRFVSVGQDGDPVMVLRQFKGTILVAEDNAANRELLRIILERSGIGYTMVDDGIQALEAYRQGHFDLILMDEQMPHMNGLEVMQKIREYEKSGDAVPTPIAAVTANVAKGVREHGIRSGYDAFVGKPIVLKELESVFEKYLEEDMGGTEVPAAVGPGIQGLDMNKLQRELMLEPEDIVALLRLFLNKIDALRDDLGKAIASKRYDAIAKAAHTIKGSSANFRIETVQKLARQMETAAIQEDATFDYTAVFEALFEALSSIKIIE